MLGVRISDMALCTQNGGWHHGFCDRNPEVDFRREAAARATERFPILIPPFTPAACWCARTIVESMACSLSPGGPRLARISNAASHTPILLQRVKRTKTEFQLPYRSGMSRQGAPVRRTQRMPLTIRRLSEIGGPRSPRSGSKGLRMYHSESVRSPDSMLPPPVHEGFLERRADTK